MLVLVTKSSDLMSGKPAFTDEVFVFLVGTQYLAHFLSWHTLLAGLLSILTRTVEPTSCPSYQLSGCGVETSNSRLQQTVQHETKKDEQLH